MSEPIRRSQDSGDKIQVSWYNSTVKWYFRNKTNCKLSRNWIELFPNINILCTLNNCWNIFTWRTFCLEYVLSCAELAHWARVQRNSSQELAAFYNSTIYSVCVILWTLLCHSHVYCDNFEVFSLFHLIVSDWKKWSWNLKWWWNCR